MAFIVLMALLLPIAILPEYSADPEDDGSEDEHQNDGYVLGPNITDDMWVLSPDMCTLCSRIASGFVDRCDLGFD